MLWAQSTKKDYIRAKHKLHSISKLFISQIITPQVVCFLSLFIFRGHSKRDLHPARWPILFCGSTHEPVLTAASTENLPSYDRWEVCTSHYHEQWRYRHRFNDYHLQHSSDWNSQWDLWQTSSEEKTLDHCRNSWSVRPKERTEKEELNLKGLRNTRKWTTWTDAWKRQKKTG